MTKQEIQDGYKGIIDGILDWQSGSWMDGPIDQDMKDWFDRIEKQHNELQKG